ncbi:MAG: DUF2817 domain-containing protein [Nitrososphaerota archaeon]
MYILLILLLIIFIFFREIFFEKINSLKYYEFGKDHPRICFLAGVHGNESAGTITLYKMLPTFPHILKKKKGSLLVIPCANPWGFLNNSRYQKNFSDINRNFSSKCRDFTSCNILRLVRDCDLVVDFHEGWSFHKINPRSIGSTISYTPGARLLAEKILERLNNHISDPKKKFTLLNDNCRIPTSLQCRLKDKNYILIETSGQNNIQPLPIRVYQIELIIDTILKFM